MKRLIFAAAMAVFVLSCAPAWSGAVQVVRTIDIPYPLVERVQGHEGAGLLGIDLETGGVYIIQSTGHRRLDEAMLWAVRQWKFVPSAGEERAFLPVHFVLEE